MDIFSKKVWSPAALCILILLCGSLTAQDAPSTDSDAGEPFVYTSWEHFTTKEGLPNDHVFAVTVGGPYVWVGTEDGLARIDKRSGAIRAWKEEEGLPWRVVSALAFSEKTGDLWIGLFGGLRAMLGMGGVVSIDPSQCPEQLYHGGNFAAYLRSGLSIMYAWILAFDGPDNQCKFLPSTITVSTTQEDCFDRIMYMDWYDFKEWPRVSSSNVGCMCGFQLQMD